MFVTNGNINSILTGVVYCLPSSTVEVDARLELNIEAAYLRNQEMHVFGYFNINFFDPACKKHQLVKAFTSFNLSQTINEVTHPDHIYTTHPGFIADIYV